MSGDDVSRESRIHAAVVNPECEDELPMSTFPVVIGSRHNSAGITPVPYRSNPGPRYFLPCTSVQRPSYLSERKESVDKRL